MFDFHPIDFILIGLYIFLLIVLSKYKSRRNPDEEHYLLSGRRLSLPAFVATLVSTWYGGILGVGEFTWLYGISQWVVMGLPYYIFAILFAFLLAGKIRGNPALTIPEAIKNSYGHKTSHISSVLIFLLVNPAPYILMVAVIAQFMLGGNPILIPVLVAFFSAVYVGVGGFTAVVRTDILQVILMYGGFFMLLFFAWQAWGSPLEMWSMLPEVHREPTGGQPLTWLFVWFFIALWTFVDPSFHQRASAAKSAKTAKYGILASVGLWFVFDILTLTTALYGVVNLSGLSNPLMVFPEMAVQLLPLGLKGLFFLTLLATIMSTLDSFLFLSGQTLGRDYLKYHFPEKSTITLTKVSIGISAVIGVILVWLLPSVIQLWYVIGSIIIPGLLIPVLGIYIPFFRTREGAGPVLMLTPVIVSSAWFLVGLIYSTDHIPLFGIEPFYPGIIASIFLFRINALSANERGSIYESE
jgi:SSS family solute:Na+ symporter